MNNMNNVILYRLDDKEALKHYGVLGMKWGMHVKGDAYKYTSIRTKFQQRKLNKINKKIDKALAKRNVNTGKVAKLKEKKADREIKVKARQSWDKARQDYAKQTSTGAEIARRLILGGAMANAYERAKSSKHDTAGSAGAAVAARYLPGVNIYQGISQTRKREKALRERQNRGK